MDSRRSLTRDRAVGSPLGLDTIVYLVSCLVPIPKKRGGSWLGISKETLDASRSGKRRHGNMDVLKE